VRARTKCRRTTAALPVPLLLTTFTSQPSPSLQLKAGQISLGTSA